ncbi:MAG TPA: glycosyltransferase family 4 protein [Candidatus Saccharimonadales bacterium]|nr:glycosyltransferase family 4 protein [Candidatus Saccharimonadales bacterium]
MKILMLGWELPPHNSGGLGVACYHMCKHLARRNVAIDFVLPYQPPQQLGFMKLHGALPLTAEQLSLGGGAYDSACFACTTTNCPHTNSLADVQQRYTTFVEQLVEQTEYHAIHAHDWLTFAAGMSAKQRSGLPLIAHVHATEFDRAGNNRGNELVHQIEQSALHMADAVIAVSELTKATLVREYGLPADKIKVVHNGIDLSDIATPDPHNSYRYLQTMKGLGYKVVVSLGRLSLQKGIPHLLRAAAKALQKDQKLLFLIVGDGEMRDQIIQQAAELGISQHVIFTGFLRGKQWRDSYAIGDMFVMPSVSEPFGLTALEAASYGNAVLLSKQSGVSEVLHNTMQFDFWDTDRLADQLVALAAHPSLHSVLTANARHELHGLNWQKAAQTFESIYAAHKAVTV